MKAKAASGRKWIDSRVSSVRPGASASGQAAPQAAHANEVFGCFSLPIDSPAAGPGSVAYGAPIGTPVRYSISPSASSSAAPAEAPKAPPRLGLGLRKTRESFLARIRNVLTASAKLDEIYEGLEEALIAAQDFTA